MRYLLLLLLPFCAVAQVNFNGAMYSNCAVTVACGTVNPPKPVDPVPLPPTPSPEPPAPPAGSGVYSTMHIGGTNNYPAVTGGTVLIYPLPANWPDGNPVTEGRIQFASSPGRNFGVETYEVSFSPTPGDFTYYTSLQGKVGSATPCGVAWGPDFTLFFSKGEGSYRVCKMDSRQWYMNFRVIACPAGQMCGNTFYVPKG
jgi:hypothetical protein